LGKARAPLLGTAAARG